MSGKNGAGKFLLKSLPGGFTNIICMNLSEKWAPEAIEAAHKGLAAKQRRSSYIPSSCASKVVREMGAGDEEMVMVSGLAGGIGLSGQGCGALGAAIWKSSLDWCKNHPGETGSLSPQSKQILLAFKDETGSEFSCHKICGKRFNSIAEHSDFVNNGGCNKLIRILAGD